MPNEFMIPRGFIRLSPKGESGQIILHARQIDSVLLIPKGIPILDANGIPSPIEDMAVVVGAMGGKVLNVPVDENPVDLLSKIDEALQWWDVMVMHGSRNQVINPQNLDIN